MEFEITKEVSRLRAHLSSLHQQLEAARTQHASSEAAVAKLSADLAELSQALRTSQDTVATIFRSRSWRWLAPVRNFNLRIHSLRGRFRIAKFFR
jgi:hypothetical protein